jgi:threonyl-tRNA synthetase
VRGFTQDDAHLFVREEQIEDEMRGCVDFALDVLNLFGFKDLKLFLATRPESFMGDVESWDRAEDALRRILDKKAGPGNYTVLEGDGAFYGPKIDILMEDSIGREWQMGTLQLDFQLPRRFDCVYSDRDGSLKTPVVLHRVIYGSLERFIGILIEHYEGAFPLWIAPIQAHVIPIADRHLDYADQVRAALTAEGIRCEVDDSDNRMNAKIRNAQLQKIPFMLVVGDKEVEERMVSVRRLTGRSTESVAVEEVVRRMRSEIDGKALPDLTRQE